MKSFAPFVAVFLLSGCVSVTADESAYSQAAKAAYPSSQPANPGEMRVAFDLTSGNPKALLLQLSTIDLTRKQLIERGITPKFALTFRGDASYFTQSDMALVKEADRDDATKIQAKIRELHAATGVDAIDQCNIPLASRKIQPGNLMHEVKLVPNGWIALVEYQQKGYSYIVP